MINILDKLQEIINLQENKLNYLIKNQANKYKLAQQKSYIEGLKDALLLITVNLN